MIYARLTAPRHCSNWRCSQRDCYNCPMIKCFTYNEGEICGIMPDNMFFELLDRGYKVITKRRINHDKY